MGYFVKQADLERDKHIMVALLEKNRTRDDTDYSKRFDWIYLNNPYGKATAWIIWDDKSNIPVGFTGAFPRPVFVNGKEYVAWNCGDFSIDKKYRTLGVAVKLRKEAKLAVDNGTIPFLYAHPNKRMEVIHLRVGHKKISQMVRFAMPLRTDRYLKEKLSSGVLATLLSWPVDTALRYRFFLKKAASTRGVFRDKVQCTPEHEQLFTKMKAQFRIIGARMCEYLQWKFADHPNFKYSQYDFYERNQLRGSLFFLQKNGVISLIDILTDDVESQIKPMFFSFIADVYRLRPAASLSFILQEHNPLIPALKQIGFKRRDDATSAVIAYANPQLQPELAQLVMDGANWFMTVGDRDA
ncbi:hypothetical protein DRI50_10925 [candidate division KSB1 bacterium]|nr:MAG: hypothetical protein DRI50_10925 [candidate division KSB1 bacterium]